MDELEGRHWWFQARRSIVGSVLQNIRAGRPGLRILEAGCGTGGNLRMLNKFGKVSAFDPDMTALRMARAKAGCQLKDGALPDNIPFQRRSFDIAVALDVIEQVEDDAASLEQLRQHLKPDGKLLITVPALPWMWSTHDEQHHHFRRYTEESLRKTLLDAGFQPEKIGYFNTLLFPVIAAMRGLKNAGLPLPANDDRLPRASMNTLLRNIFALERHLIHRIRLPIGVSLMAVCNAAR